MVEEVLDSTQLIEYVIDVSKDVFKEDEKYLGKTKINKLTICVFEELSKQNIEVEGFVWGFHRYGFYSPTTSNYIDFKFGDTFRLNSINKIGRNISDNIYWIFFSIISKLKPNFRLDNKKKFPKWLYSLKTPEEYRSFYKSHRNLIKWFDNMINNEFQMDIYKKYDRGVDQKITEYHRSLWFIDDDETLELFYKYTDLIEDLTIKLNNGYDPYKIKYYLKELNGVYDTIFTILTPYSLTLKGDPNSIESEKSKHKIKINSIKNDVKLKLDELYSIFAREGLSPTFEETQQALKDLMDNAPPGTKSLDEIHEILFDPLEDTSK